ncbi:MAG TPA: polysaccharide biosynthesis tyrosine autokinase, partial [Tepidisphaeraceae bacterium]|nr:polysaccharide biosynthesis tyrosine autokinase [Tepidisphaeraceae bacterium]
MSSMQKMLPAAREEFASPVSGPAEDPGSATILEVLWLRRTTLLLTVLALVFVAACYLVLAPRVYSSTAQVYVEQGKSVYSDHAEVAPHVEDFLYTQAEVVRSSPVLSRALSAVHSTQLKTLAKVNGDPIDWLKNSGALTVEVGKKGDVLNISMESPYPQEAAALVNSIVEAFVYEQTRQRETTGGAMVRILRREEADLQKQRDGMLRQIEQLKQGSGRLSFTDEKQNTALDHLSSLSKSYNEAQLSTINLRAELNSATAILATPERVPAYIEAQQTKSRDTGDKEYDEMRSSLSQLLLSTTANGKVVGTNNPRLQALQADVEMLRKRIAEKEQAMVRARVQDLTVELASAEDKERQVKAALETEQTAHLALVPQSEEYAKLKADVERIQKQCDQIDGRISEITTNSTSAGALNVQVLDNARPGIKPVKPNKTLILAMAGFVGLLLGGTLCMISEWHDPRLRRPDEVAHSLGVPIIGIVPRIPPQLSVADRGQLVHIDPMSPAAEAYRTLRTAVNFGPVPDARTILVVSPLPGDGKSTTASNLAIALAEAGHRTLLIDADMRRPVQHAIFGIQSPGGLSSVLNGTDKLRDVVHATGVGGLSVLPTGPVPRNPAELLGGKQFKQVMEALGTAFDRIVIDSPPLAPVTDGRILASMAHATLLVLRVNQSDRRASAAAVEGLHKVGANLLGAVVNDVVLAQEFNYYYGNSAASGSYVSGEPAARQIAAAV